MERSVRRTSIRPVIGASNLCFDAIPWIAIEIVPVGEINSLTDF
jgi:hypothetical protein